MATQHLIDNSVYISTRDRKIKALAKMVRQKKDLRSIYDNQQTPPEWAEKSIDDVIKILASDLRENERWKELEDIRLSEGNK